MPDMNLELHHFFILVEPGATAADRLLELGLLEAPANPHEGQGTTNRRFFFSNCALEFLWVHDEAEALNGRARDLMLVQRSKDSQASPFGLIVVGGDEADTAMPFDGWKYQPVYFPEKWAFHIGANSNTLSEPLCIYAPFFDAPNNSDLPDIATFRNVSQVTVHVAASPLSDCLKAVGSARRLSIVSGDEHLLELTFDNNAQGRMEDLRPDLPLIIRW